LIVLAVRLVAGADFPGYKYFMGSLIGGALWPIVSGLLRLPQRRKSDLNHG
jgi:rod shape-determining protein MreD